MLGIMVGTMALIIVLSVFNGMEDLVRSLFGSFDPQLKIAPVEGKTFRVNTAFIESIKNIEGVEVVTEVAEDNVLLKYRDKQMVVKMKGVSNNFASQNTIEKYIVEGNFQLYDGKIPLTIIGRGIQYVTGIPANEDLYPVQFWYPKPGKGIPSSPETAFNRKNIYPSGVFAIEKEFDEKYVFVPLNFALELFDFRQSRTSLEIKVADGVKPETVQKKLYKLLGKTRFKIQTQDEQHASLIRAVKIEKLFVYFTFSVIIAIASLNIFYSLVMLVLDKKKDIAILQSLGITPKSIFYLFMYEGAIVAFIGAGIGLALGFVVCYLQANYGIVSMGMQSSIVEAYPVKIKFSDFVFTGVIIVSITFLTSVVPALRASRIDIKESVGKR